MDKEELLTLGVDEDVAEVIAGNMQKMKDEYEARCESVRREWEAESLIRESGARNTDIIKALIKPGEDITEQIEKLKRDKETSFLFEGRKSYEPKRSPEKLPDTKKTGFEERLKAARRDGNTVEAIRIKQLAASEGIMLL